MKLPLARYMLRRVQDQLLRRTAVALALPLTRPASIHLRLTDRCNFRCQHCDCWKLPREHVQHELDTAAWRDVLAQLRRWIGPCAVHLTGGEVLLRPDLLPIVERARQLGLQVQINTNGSLLDEDLARRLLLAEVGIIMVSLYGVRAETHEQLQGVEGCFPTVRGNLERLAQLRRQLGASTQVRAGYLVTRSNLDQAEPFVHWAARQDIGVVFQPLYENLYRPHGPDWQRDHPLWPEDQAAVARTWNTIGRLKRAGLPVVNSHTFLRAAQRSYDPANRFARACDVGASMLVVDPQGKVRFCYIGQPFGDVRDAPLEHIWRSGSARRRRQEARDCNRGCRVLYCTTLHKSVVDRSRDVLAQLLTEVRS